MLTLASLHYRNRNCDSDQIPKPSGSLSKYFIHYRMDPEQFLLLITLTFDFTSKQAPDRAVNCKTGPK